MLLYITTNSMRPSTACSVASALRALQHLEAPSSVDEVVGGFLSGQFGRLPLQVRPMPSVYAQFAIGWRNWCGARGNLQGARGLIKNWQVADVGKRAIRVELSVRLVLHEATHFHRIDQARDDAVLCSSGSAITGVLILVSPGVNSAGWSATFSMTATAASVSLPALPGKMTATIVRPPMIWFIMLPA